MQYHSDRLIPTLKELQPAYLGGSPSDAYAPTAACCGLDFVELIPLSSPLDSNTVIG